MFEVMTRRQAAESGRKRYYTGRLCNKGHDSQRFTSTGACIKCAAGYVQQYNDRLKKETNARAAGQFFYPSHPDDVAAMLAYGQALDMQRGRMPWIPPATLKETSSTFDVLAARRHALGSAADQMPSMVAVMKTLPAHALTDEEDDALTDAANAAHNAAVMAAWSRK